MKQRRTARRLRVERTDEKKITAKIILQDQARYFGTHLTLDGYGGDPKLLDDMERVFHALDVLPEQLGMRKITTPYVVHFPGNGRKDLGGHSGFVMIAESHISVHTFPKNRFVSIDVYTCQGDLDTQKSIDFFTRVFKLKDVETNLIRRGHRYFDLR